MEFSRVEPSYTSKEGCRLIWLGVDEDDQDAVILNKSEFEQLIEILKQNSTGRISLEDQVSNILINSDVTQFNLTDHRYLEAKTTTLQKQVLEYAKIPHEPQYIHISSKEFYPSVWIRKDEEPEEIEEETSKKHSLLDAILSSEPEKIRQDLSETDLFRIFSTRRSTRRFDKTTIEEEKALF